MNKQKSLTRNLVYNILYQIMNMVLPILTIPYLSRVLGPDRIGAYSYSLSIATYFGMFGLLGTLTYGQLLLVKHLNQEDELSKVFKIVLASRLITFGIVAIGYSGVILYADSFRDLYIALIVYLISQLFDICWFYQGMELFKLTVSRSAVAKLLSVVLIFIFVKNENDLIIYITIQQGATLAANLSMWIPLKRYIKWTKVTLLDVLKSIKENFVFFVPTIASMIFVSLDKCMIGWITKSTLENGYYEQANRIYNLLIVLITSLTAVVLPRMAFLRQEENSTAIEQLIEKSIRYITFIVLPISAGLFCVLDNFVPLFFGQDFNKCADILKVFSVMIVFTSYNSIISNQCMVANGKQKKLNILLIASSIINISANVLLIKMYSSLGAAIASVISESILFILIIITCKNEIPFKKWFVAFFRYGSLCIVFCLIEFVLVNPLLNNGLIKLLIQMVVGGVIYIIGLMLLKDELILYLFDKIRRRKA